MEFEQLERMEAYWIERLAIAQTDEEYEVARDAVAVVQFAMMVNRDNER